MSWSIAIDEGPMSPAEKLAWAQAEDEVARARGAAPVGFAHGVLHTEALYDALELMGWSMDRVDLEPAGVKWIAETIPSRAIHLRPPAKTDALAVMLFFQTAARFHRAITGGL